MTDDDHDGGVYDDSEPPEPDAFFAWALGPARAAYFSVSGEVDWLPVLVELHDITVSDFADGIFDGEDAIAGWRSSVQVHDVFGYLQERIDAPMPVVPALVTRTFFEVERSRAAVRKHLRSVSLGSAMPLDTTSESPSAPFDPPGGPPEPVAPPDPPDPSALATSVTGIIDDGIAFLNDRFRDNFVSTRFHSVWVQTGGGGFPGGFVITKSAIDNDLLQLFDNTADEADLYAAAGVLDFTKPNIHQSLGLSRTHGAAVTDAAAGNRQTAATANRPIVAVQLPTDAVKDPSLSRLELEIIFGLAFLVWETKKIAAEHGVTWLPLAINLSFGNIAGPHNGRSWLELWMDWLIGGWRAAVGPIELVIASGNNKESRTHAVVGFEALGDSVALPWRVLPDDKTISSVQLWMPPPTFGPPRVRMRVVVPGGSGATAWLEEGGGTVSWLDGAGDPICRLHSAFDVLAGRTAFTVLLQPTETLDTSASGAPTGPVATSGVWTIEIENLALPADERIEAWIARDDTPFTYPRLGRQSYFDAECYRRLEDGGYELPEDDPACMIKRDGTISGIATGCEPVVIGGFLRREREMAEYSSGGPTSTAPCPGLPARTGPDAVAVSDDSRDHRGAIAAGTYSGSAVALDGTSMAAPPITRLVADRMASGLPAGRAAIQGLGASLSEPYPVERIGGGAITTPPAHPVARYVPWPWIWMPPP